MKLVSNFNEKYKNYKYITTITTTTTTTILTITTQHHYLPLLTEVEAIRNSPLISTLYPNPWYKVRFNPLARGEKIVPVRNQQSCVKSRSYTNTIPSYFSI